MGNTEVPGETTYDLKWWNDFCMGCKGCEDDVRKRLEKIDGVNSIGKIKIDNRQGKVTIKISGTVGRHTVKEELQKSKKINYVKLIPSKVRPPQPQQHIVPRALDESTIWKKSNDRDHPELKRIRFNERFRCDGCKEDGFGPRHRCEEKNCAFQLHQECRNPNPTKAIKLFHGSRKTTFEFRRNPPSNKRCCDVCGKYIRGCSYIYRDGVDSNLNLDLHPQCSNFETQIQVRGTVFELRGKNKLEQCLWCNKKKSPAKKQSGIRGWSYVSKCNNYHFHLCCVTEMFLEAWKEFKAPEITYFRRTQKRDGDGRGREFWEIVTMVLSTIAGILLGDPAGLIVSTAVQLLKFFRALVS